MTSEANHRNVAEQIRLAQKLFASGQRSQAFAIIDSLVEHAACVTSPPGIGTAPIFLARSGMRRALGEYDAALADDYEARRREPNYTYKEVGVTLWLSGRHAEACAEWAGEIKRRYADKVGYFDAAGGVEVPALLWWASAHPGLELSRKPAVTELGRRWRTRRCQLGTWPAPIAGYLLGELSEEDMLAKVNRQVEKLTTWQTAQARFYISATRLANGDSEGYYRELESSLELTPRGLTESALARYELEPTVRAVWRQE